MSVLQQFLDLWSDQKFLGEVCTFGDDRHLTNRMLQLGYCTKYTPRSVCYTETPAQYTRWLAQQVRWSKSYFREWLFNALWWHKHHLWMVYENIVAGGFPFFVIATMIDTFYSGSLWNIIYLLLTIQTVGTLKGIFTMWVHGSPLMIFMSLYSSLYITSLLPGKLFAIATINKKGWGTSGRKSLLKNYNSLIPVTCWLVLLFCGLLKTLITNDYGRKHEARHLIYGLALYIFYWVAVVGTWKLFVQGQMKKKTDFAEDKNKEGDAGEESQKKDDSAKDFQRLGTSMTVDTDSHNVDSSNTGSGSETESEEGEKEPNVDNSKGNFPRSHPSLAGKVITDLPCAVDTNIKSARVDLVTKPNSKDKMMLLSESTTQAKTNATNSDSDKDLESGGCIGSSSPASTLSSGTSPQSQQSITRRRSIDMFDISMKSDRADSIVTELTSSNVDLAEADTTVDIEAARGKDEDDENYADFLAFLSTPNR